MADPVQNAAHEGRTRRERMIAWLDGLPTSRADEMPPGSVCGLCALHRHVFVHPHAIPGSHWSLVDGCPCCETHVPAWDERDDVIWPSDPPLGVSDGRCYGCIHCGCDPDDDLDCCYVCADCDDRFDGNPEEGS